MSNPSLVLLLVVLFTSVLLCAVSLVLLRVSAPREALSRGEMFARGSVPPYSALISLRAKYLLPWIYPAQLAGAGLLPRASFWLARLGAYGAIGALIGLAVSPGRF